jgi:hypothetical protein
MNTKARKCQLRQPIIVAEPFKKLKSLKFKNCKKYFEIFKNYRFLQNIAIITEACLLNKALSSRILTGLNQVKLISHTNFDPNKG